MSKEEDYIPFGKEWEKEMMKLPKRAIIQMFKICAKDREELIVESIKLKKTNEQSTKNKN